MNPHTKAVSPKDRTPWPTGDAFRAIESRALYEALRAQHPLNASKLVSKDVYDATGFEIKPDTVQSWMSDGRTPSPEALGALDATYGAPFVLRRRLPFSQIANARVIELRAAEVAYLAKELADKQVALAQMSAIDSAL